MPANLSRLHIPCPTRPTGRGEVCRGPDNKPSGFPGQTYEHTYEIYAEGEADNIHLYKPGGLHPVIVGDVLNNGRYHLVHKLGAGDASTVWLARDLHHQGGSQPNDPLVSIKILQASEKSTTSVAPNELSVVRALQSSVADRGREDVASQLLSIRSMFTEEGPNGSHVCLVSPVAGPSLDWGEWYSLRRFRPDVGRKICKQVTEAVQHIHASGYVHGDLRPVNVLFRLNDKLQSFSNDQIYGAFDKPELMRLIRNDERALDAHAPRAVVAPIEMEKFDEAGLLREDIVVIGLKSSFVAGTISPMYDVRYANNYRAPELLLQTELTQAVDIWALACLIFDTRAGRPFFHSIWHVNDVLEEIVSRRGRLPEHLWSSWKNRSEYFHENGVAKEPYDYPSIRNELERVATDDWKLRWEHTLLDQLGNRIPQEEVMLLDDLLGKMLRCDPDERITIDEVISHPWFAFR